MKPLGLTADFRTIVHADRVQDAIYSAVEQAIEAGWDVDRFRSEAAECWRIVLDEKKQRDMAVWSQR